MKSRSAGSARPDASNRTGRAVSATRLLVSDQQCIERQHAEETQQIDNITKVHSCKALKLLSASFVFARFCVP
jgi:hypothetical protein